MSCSLGIPVPPPQPPPLGEGSRRSFSPNFNGNSAPSIIIQPTTAGLLHHHGFSTGTNQEVNGISGQQVVNGGVSLIPERDTNSFKSELIKKQQELSNASKLTSIEDRIISNKNSLSNSPIGDFKRGIVTDSETATMNYLQSNIDYLPEKLQASSKREIRPFAYSPDVNDPNNRGRIDLSQIKSPMMRQRLLANLKSSEDDEEDGVDENTSIDGGKLSETDSFAITQPIVNHRPVTKIVHYDPGVFRNLPPNDFVSEFRNTLKEVKPEVRYNEPIVFRGPDVERQRTQETKPMMETTVNSYDELNTELEQILSNFNEFVSNINVSNENQDNSRQANRSATLRGANNHQKTSTFLPREAPKAPRSNHANIEYYQPPWTRNVENQYYTRTLPSPRSSPSIGDFLLSHDTNYYASPRASQTSSIYPYYGGH